MDKAFFHFPREKVEQSATMRTPSRRATQKNQQKSGAFLKIQIKNTHRIRGRAYGYPTDHTRDLKGERFPPLEIPPYIPKYEYANAHAHAIMCFHAHAHERTHINPRLLRSKATAQSALIGEYFADGAPKGATTKRRKDRGRRSRK